MDRDDLDLVPTDDLIDALHRRMGPYGSLLVTGTSWEGAELVAWRGGQTSAMGMAMRAVKEMLNSNSKRVDPDGT